jgi:hypothetical protein
MLFVKKNVLSCLKVSSETVSTVKKIIVLGNHRTVQKKRKGDMSSSQKDTKRKINLVRQWPLLSLWLLARHNPPPPRTGLFTGCHSMTTTGRPSFSDYLQMFFSYRKQKLVLCSNASASYFRVFGQNSEISTASVDEERDSQNNGMVTKNDFY